MYSCDDVPTPKTQSSWQLGCRPSYYSLSEEMFWRLDNI